MKRFLKAAAVFGVSAVVLSGCATKSYVDQQISPLKSKISDIEKRLGAVESEISGLKAQNTDISNKLEQIEREHADIKARLEQAEGTASAAYKKASSNEQAIEDLNATLKRQSVNVERILGNHYAK